MNRQSALRFRVDGLRPVPALVAVMMSAICLASPGMAKKRAHAPAPDRYSAIVVDAATGETLYAKNPDARRYPASLTKMMTLHVLFGELQAKRLTLDSQLSVSQNAAAQAPTKLGLRPGTTIRVEDAIMGLTTKSANDAAMVIAENIGGSASGFAARMNRTARAIGMNSTTFRNPNGLPDPGQTTTARDMATLGQSLQTKYPEYYRFFSVRSFTYKGSRIRNHNRLLGSVDGVDGIKTGYTRASGFNLVTNVRRDGRHIVGVVLGGRSAGSRDADMRKLIVNYLPAAKRGGGGTAALVADAAPFAATGDGGDDAEDGDVIAGAADAGTERTGRMPRPRPATDDGADAEALAYADPHPARDIVKAALAAADAASEEGDLTEKGDVAPDDRIAKRIESATAVAELADASSGELSSDVIARLSAQAQRRAGATELVASARHERTVASAASAGAPAGWQIQIGAVPTVEGAKALLDRVQDTMGPVLSARRPVTVNAERDGETFYRARFAGFSGKEDARAACAKLKTKAISCLAVPS